MTLEATYVTVRNRKGRAIAVLTVYGYALRHVSESVCLTRADRELIRVAVARFKVA